MAVTLTIKMSTMMNTFLKMGGIPIEPIDISFTNFYHFF